MSKILQSIDKHLDIITKKLDPGSANTLKGSLLRITTFIVLCIFTMFLLSFVYALIMVYFPRFTSCVILTSIAIPLGVIITSLFFTKITATAWKISLLLSVFLTFTGVGLFGVGHAINIMRPIRSKILPQKVRFPLGELGCIALDSNGCIYLAVQAYSRIQVYSSEGDFLRGWFVESSGEVFDIWFENNNLLNVITRKTYNHDIFDVNGHLIERKKNTSFEKDMRFRQIAGGLSVPDVFGNIYLIKSPLLFPKVVKITPKAHRYLLIKDPFYFQLVRTPLSAWLLVVSGLIMFALLYRKIKKKVNFKNLIYANNPSQ